MICRTTPVLSLLLAFPLFILSQNQTLDSLKTELAASNSHEDKLELYIALARNFDKIKADSSEKYIELAEAEMQEADPDRKRYEIYDVLSQVKYKLTKNQEMLDAAQKAQQIAYQIGDSLLIAETYRTMALSIPAVSRQQAKDFILKAIEMIEDSTEKLKRFHARNYEYYAYLLQYENPRLAHGYRSKVLEQAIVLNDSNLMASSYNGIALYYRNFKVDSALYFFRQAVKINEARNRRSVLADNYVNIANCYQVKDFKDSVIYYSENALKLGRETSNISPIRQSLRLFLAHYRGAGEYEKALDHAKEMLELDKEHPSGYRSMIWLDFASIYKEMGKTDTAILYLERARDQGLEDKYPPSVATAYAYLGEVEMELNNLDNAKNYFQEADKMYARMNIEAARVRSFHRLGQIDVRQGNFRSARINFDKLLEISLKLDDISSQAVAYEGLAKCDSAAGNAQSAYKNLLNYSQLQDSFSRKNFNEEVAEMQTRFEAEKREAEIKNLAQANQIQSLELEQTSIQRNFAILLALFLAMIAVGIVYFMFRLRTNKIKIEAQANELEELNQTKDRLFGIIAHDLRGPVSGFQTLGKIFTYHIKNDNKDKLLALTGQLEKQGVQVKNLLDNLLQWSIQQLGTYRPQWERVLLNPLGKEVMDAYEESSRAKENELEIVIPEDLEARVDKNGLLVVLNNLLGNAIKFTEQGKIKLSAEKREAHLHLEVSDTGKGMSPEQLAEFRQTGSLKSEKGTSGEKGTGLGLNLVQQIIDQWEGKMQIESQLEKGTSVKIEFPIA
ncbi:MAG: ATP-binding protein [Bacteroidota bacterium]